MIGTSPTPHLQRMSSRSPRLPRHTLFFSIATVGLLGLAGILSRHDSSSQPFAPDQNHAAPIPVERDIEESRATGLRSDPDLWEAVAKAQLAIQPLTAGEAALDQNRGVSHFAWHPGQDLSARFMPNGVRFSSGDGEHSTVTFRYDGRDRTSSLAVEGPRAEYHHADGITEWFVNGRDGIEHGFTLTKAPASSHEIQLKIRLDGLVAVAGSHGDELLLQDEECSPRLRYAGLKAWDADGDPVPATMTPDETGILIAVNDEGARYPLTIDPVITSLAQQIRPVIEGTDGGGTFSQSIALDGDTALIGAPNSSTAFGVGAAYVFVKSGGTWNLQAYLHATTPTDNIQFGKAVDLQGDRAVITALNVSAPGNTNSGSVHVFERSGGTWEFRALIPSNRSSNDYFGESVALDHDTIAVGIRRANIEQGAVSIYVLDGTIWTLQQTLNSPQPTQWNFGEAIDLDGNRLVAGASTPGTGTAFLYTRSGSTWAGQQIPAPASLHDNSRFGCSVAIDGGTVVVGAIYQKDDQDQTRGAAFAYLNSGSDWTIPQVLGPDEDAAYQPFGMSVAVDGDLLAVGACHYPHANYGLGAVYVYERPATTWEKKIKLAPPGYHIMSSLGAKVAVSGQRVLASAPTHSYNGHWGVAAVFSGPDWSQETQLTPGDDHQGEEFGAAVAIEGNTAMIGIGKATTPTATSKGEVMVLSRQGGLWTVTQRFTSTHDGGENFGSTLSLDEDTVMIGAPSYLASEIGEGCAYIFAKQDGLWLEQARILDPVPSYGGHFGSIIAMDGTIATVGKPASTLAACVVHVFTRNGIDWSQREELKFPAGESGENFGSALAVEGNTILVGTPANSGSAQPSTVQVFTRSDSGWTREASLAAVQDGPDVGLGFGASVAISGNTALIGAPYDLPLTQQSRGNGRCYFYKRSGSNWSVEQTIYSGEGPHGDRFGTAVALDGDVAVVGATELFVPFYPSAEKAAYIFTREADGWIRQSSHLPEGDSDFLSDFRKGTRVAVSGDTVLVAVSGVDRLNPFTGLMREYGQVDVLDLSGKDGAYLKLLDADYDGGISLGEWLGFHGTAKKYEKEFRALDADDSGALNLEEILDAKTLKEGARLKSSIERVGIFMDLDLDKDQWVTRSEIRIMYLPGTAAKDIDAFWSRSGAGEGFDLEAWVRAKTLPSISTYEMAIVQRQKRRSLALEHDANHDGRVQFEEFQEMFPGMKASKVEALWRVALELPKRASFEGFDLEHGYFVDYAKLPLF
jgi:hypothetical protein